MMATSKDRIDFNWAAIGPLSDLESVTHGVDHGEIPASRCDPIGQDSVDSFKEPDEKNQGAPTAQPDFRRHGDTADAHAAGALPVLLPAVL